jgi:PIN domain nuclease of toxin-antitoxin system
MVLDTHTWVWFHRGDSRLTVATVDAIKMNGPRTTLSAATVWELALLIEKGRIDTGMSPAETVSAWLGRTPMRVIPIDAEIALLSRSLPFQHEDPADRFIAATAHRLGAPLATSDARLLSLPWLKTVS